VHRLFYTKYHHVDKIVIIVIAFDLPTLRISDIFQSTCKPSSTEHYI